MVIFTITHAYVRMYTVNGFEKSITEFVAHLAKNTLSNFRTYIDGTFNQVVLKSSRIDFFTNTGVFSNFHNPKSPWPHTLETTLGSDKTYMLCHSH